MVNSILPPCGVQFAGGRAGVDPKKLGDQLSPISKARLVQVIVEGSNSLYTIERRFSQIYADRAQMFAEYLRNSACAVKLKNTAFFDML